MRMGVVAEIGYDEFPKQSRYVGMRVEVCFRFNTEQTINGTIIRDDVTEPHLTIIQLDDKRVVLGTECQYRLPEVD